MAEFVFLRVRTGSALLPEGRFFGTRCPVTGVLPARLGQLWRFGLATLVDIRSSKAPHCLIRRWHR